jgi:hypothetical protein
MAGTGGDRYVAEVYDWEDRIDRLPLDQAMVELRALSPRTSELIDGHTGGLPAHLPDAERS